MRGSSPRMTIESLLQPNEMRSNPPVRAAAGVF